MAVHNRAVRRSVMWRLYVPGRCVGADRPYVFGWQVAADCAARRDGPVACARAARRDGPATVLGWHLTAKLYVPGQHVAADQLHVLGRRVEADRL